MRNRIFESLLQSEAWKKSTAILPIAVYDAETEQPVILDLATMPHLLIGGVVGSGKRILLDTIIAGLTSHMSIDHLQLVISDCKIIEFDKYRNMPYLMKPVLNATHEILATLGMMQEIISTRYQMLANAALANIKDYHDKHLSGMPYVIIILSAFED